MTYLAELWVNNAWGDKPTLYNHRQHLQKTTDLIDAFCNRSYADRSLGRQLH